MSVQTKLSLKNNKIGQTSSEVFNIGGSLIFESGSTLQILENRGNGKVLTSDENGIIRLQELENDTVFPEYMQLTHVDEHGMLITYWDITESYNAHITINELEDLYISIDGLENGMSGDLYINVIEDSSIILTSNPYFAPSYVDGAYYFDNNKVFLAKGKYHLAFTTGNNWIHVNIAGYNNLTGTYVDSIDFLNHINDNNRHLTLIGQTFQGVKTFIDIPILPNANPTTENQATRKKYVDDSFVSKTKTESISGQKTFIDIPLLPNIDPTTSNEATRKKYVDDLVGNLYDENGKISVELLPDLLLGAVRYKGTWNANTNTPTIPTADAENSGEYYKTIVAGTYNGVEYRIGDWIISDGGEWSKVDNTDNVITVNGKDGIVTLYSTDITLTSTDNTTIKTALDGKAITNHIHNLGTDNNIQGILPVSKGGTGASSATTYTIPYWGSTTALSSSANMVWNTTYNTLSIGGSTVNNYYGLKLHRPTNTTVFTRVSNTTATTGIDFGLGASGVGRIWHNGNYGISIGTNNTERISISNTGVTDFKVIPTLPSTDPTTTNQAVRKGWADSAYVQTGNVSQLVDGVKSFINRPTFNPSGLEPGADDRDFITRSDGDSFYSIRTHEHEVSFVRVTVNRTLELTDAWREIQVNNSSARTITIPLHSSVAYPIGTMINVRNINTGLVTISGASGVTVYGFNKIRTRYFVVNLLKYDNNIWYLTGGEE